MLEENTEFEELNDADCDIRKEDQTEITVWEDNWDDEQGLFIGFICILPGHTVYVQEVVTNFI